MRRIAALVFFMLTGVCSSFSLNIDWDTLTNMAEVTQPTVVPAPEPELPNSYLSSGKIDPIVLESYARRFDLVFFISLPISFYLMMNIMQVKNQLIYLNGSLSEMDWNFVYWNTLLTSFLVAYQDNIFYYQKHPDIPLIPPAVKETSEVKVQLPVLSYRF